MASRFGILVVICLCMTSAAAAQVVRFETTMGNIDMVLNPTNNPLLQGQVDNFLHYIDTNRYLGSWVNRAGKGTDGSDFVLQMGELFSHTKRPPLTIDSTRFVATFDPVQHVEQTGLSNTVGTVSLALSGGNPDSGTSSFFINLNDNSFLDSQGFTPFAEVSDLSVVQKIMDLPPKDFRNDPLFSADPRVDPKDTATFATVPVQSDGFQVFIKRAFVLSDMLDAAKAVADANALASLSATSLNANPLAASLSGLSNDSGSGESLLSSNNAVPEPGSLLLAAVGALSMGRFAIRRRRSGEQA
jgi:peptidyl-prolyl cis-trans isomerase A (cyclophilin A)